MGAIRNLPSVCLRLRVVQFSLYHRTAWIANDPTCVGGAGRRAEFFGKAVLLSILVNTNIAVNLRASVKRNQEIVD